MNGIRISIAAKGYSQAAKKLEKVMAIALRPSVPAMKAAIWLTGQTIRVFAEGGRPEKWAPLSLMTLFVRVHRAEKPNKSPQVMSDTGRLKGSFIPVIEDDGVRFGASTNVEYAALMQSGGPSEPNEVQIASFTRRLRSRQATAYAGGKLQKLGKQTVRDYTIHFKGGGLVPARPFFPEGIAQLDAWGYHAKIKEIFAMYFREAAA